MNVAPGYEVFEENKRKIEAKEIPSILIPCPLIVFETW